MNAQYMEVDGHVCTSVMTGLLFSQGSYNNGGLSHAEVKVRNLGDTFII